METSLKILTEKVCVYPSSSLNGTIQPPSSKYHTLRYILAAFLAHGTSTVYYPAESDDTDVLLRACMLLGSHIQNAKLEDDRHVISIRGIGGNLKMPTDKTIDVGNAGAVLRLLLGICALSSKAITFTTPYPDSLGRRPNADLLQALEQLGAIVEMSTNEGTLPIKIRGGQLHGDKVRISGKRSSQYISSLLFLAPLLKEGLDIEIVDELASASFLDLTIEVLEMAGITVITIDPYERYIVPGMQQYQPRNFLVPGDYPSAAALIASVAVAKGEVAISNLQQSDSNGEAILKVFSEMGVRIERAEDTIIATSSGNLCGVSIDGSKTIDSIPVIVAAACYANSPSRIYNVANLHLKESDRINDLAQELNKAGCHVLPSEDAIEIHPAGPHGIYGGVELDAHADHRLIEAFAAIGLATKRPITISNTIHIAKSYPQFFHDLNVLGARIEQII